MPSLSAETEVASKLGELMWLQAPENDYGALAAEPSASPSLKVAVCMPVYNRVDLLARTVAALIPQTYPSALMEVVVGDDGSDEDVETAIAGFRDRLRITVQRRERSGYGAGQARNMAARSTDAEVLVFIDADCLPDNNLVAAHADWHHKAENLVVIGSRHGLDTSDFNLEHLASGRAPLRRSAFGTDEPSPKDLRPRDHRDVLHRRTADQRHGDEAFRSLVSSNFSIRRDRFFEVGGFDESFSRWGGEDVELGWRCQTAGLFIVAADDAVCFHQTQDDLWDETGREDSKSLNAGVIQNKIPHSFYRKYRVDHVWEVPKVSVVVFPTVPARLDELADQIRRQTYTDWEFIVSGGTPEATLFAEMNGHDRRFRVITDADDDELIRAARGEYVAVVHGDLALEPRLLVTTVKKLENQRRSAVALSAYKVGDTIYRHPDDTAAIDQAWNNTSTRLPLFHMARRREWSKALHSASSVGAAYDQIQNWSTPIRLAEAYVAVRSERPGANIGSSHTAFVSPTTRLRSDLVKSGLSVGSVKAVARYLKKRVPSPAPSELTESEAKPREPAAEQRRPTVRYVGWTGHDNMGDEALLRAVTNQLSWADVKTSKRGDLLLLGGGTLINRGSYITWLEEQDSPRIERAVFGTGVANPHFWGDRGQQERWVDWLDTCAYVGVRGPDSAHTLSSWGVKAEVEVVGDAALLFEPAAARQEGRVVIAPARTRGELWGGNDSAVFTALGDLAAKLVAEGHDVHLLASHPDDDGPIIQIGRHAGHTDLPYLAAYDDLDAALDLMASADLVVAERLHAAVLAAAASTPFVALEYRPKVRDFARSVGFDDLTIRTDEMTGLEEATRSALADRDRLSAQLATRVEEYRVKLRAASGFLAGIMGTEPVGK